MYTRSHVLTRALLLGFLVQPIAVPALAQPLAQITSCVEVPLGIVSASRRRASTRADCSPQAAREEARQGSRANARDALDSICREQISEAEADVICEAAGGVTPPGSTSLSATAFGRSGASAVDAQLPVSQAEPRLCVVLRDLGVVSTATRANPLCVFNGLSETVVRFRARARCGVQCSQVKQHQFRVARHDTAAITSAEAAAITADATALLRSDEGAGDVSCKVTLSTVSPVASFTQGDGAVDSKAEFDGIVDRPEDVTVVNAINFCSQLQPNVIGCAPVGGNSFAVVRFTPALEGILWAHEFGHNQGLNHRSGANAVMNGNIGNTRRRVTSTECSAFQVVGASAFSTAAATAVTQPVNPQDPDVAEPVTDPPDVERFVRQLFIHGVPYEEATTFGSGALPRLLEMLADPRDEPYWANIVVVLGMIGDERALAGLTAFIERPQRQNSAAHYRARASAIMSLGYLVNKAGSRAALDYLVTGLSPATWARRAGAGRAPYQRSQQARDRDFAKHAILGLALSGHADAPPALRALLEPGRIEGERAFRAEVRDVVTTALQEHEVIARRGLAEYYRDR